MFNYKDNQWPHERPPTLSEYDMAKKEMKIFEKKTYFTLTGDELNDLISKNLVNLVKNPGRFENFECVAEFKWNNYARYEVSVSKNDFMSNLYKKYDRQEVIDAEYGSMYGHHQIFAFMLEHGIIKEGNYLIDPSW